MRILYIDSENIKLTKFDLLMLSHNHNFDRIKIYMDIKKPNNNQSYYEKGLQWINTTVLNIDTLNRRNYIDIHIMLDVLEDIHYNQCNEIFIATHDSDYLPLAFKCKTLNVPLHFVVMRKIDWIEKVSHLCITQFFDHDLRIIGECFCAKQCPVLSLSNLKKTLKSLNTRRNFSSQEVFKHLESFLAQYPDLFVLEHKGRCLYITLIPLWKKINPPIKRNE